MKDLDLRGKDYFTQAEAMHYLSIDDEAKFQDFSRRHGILPVPVMDALLYRRDDLKYALDNLWRQNIREETPGISSIPKMGSTKGRHLARLPKPKRKPKGLQRKSVFAAPEAPLVRSS